MFCNNCGKQLNENEAFCTECGAPVSNVVEEIKTEPSSEQTVYPSAAEAVTNAQPEGFTVRETYDLDESSFEEPPKKKKTGLIIGLIVTAVVLAIAAFVIFNFKTVEGYAVKWFGSETDYLQFVEQKSFEQGIEGITGVYYDMPEAEEAAGSVAKLEPKLGDSAKELAGDIPLDWINELSLSVTGEAADGKSGGSVAVALSDSEVLKVDMAIDTKEQILYLALANLSDKFIKIDMAPDDVDAVYAEDGVLSVDLTSVLNDPEFKKAMPSEKELNALLARYAEIAVSHLEATGTSTMEVTAGELTKKYTVIEYELTEKDLYEIAQAVLEAAKADKELENMINSVCDYLVEKEVLNADVDYYGEFEELLEDGIDWLESNIDQADTEDALTVKNLVDEKHEICGRVLEADGIVMSYVTVKKGNKFAFEAEIDETDSEEIEIEGSGELKGTELNAKYTLKVGGKAYVDLILEEIDALKLRDYKIDGTIRIEFTDSLVEELGESGLATYMKEHKVSFEIKSEIEEKTSKTEINILSDGNLFAGLDISTEITESDGEISIPSDAIDPADEEALLEWMQSLDMDKITQALRDGGLDEDLAATVELYIDQLQMMLDPDYYYDDYDDYYGDMSGDFYGDYTYNDGYTDY